MNINRNTTSKILDCCYSVHSALGAGLYEKVYQEALALELMEQGFSIEREVPVVALYKGRNLGLGYRMDLVVEKMILLELKAVKRITDVHKSQLLTYLKLSGLALGFLLNFNAVHLRDGIVRYAVGGS